MTAPRSLWWIGLLALAGYAFFLARHSAPVAGGSDSSGYLNSARLFASGQLLTDLRAPAEFGPRAKLDPMHFLPQGFFPHTDPGRLTPTYPTGLPLHFAAAGLLLGWENGPLLVMLLAAVAALWLCYLLARELGVSPWLAAAGAVAVASFPPFLFTSIQPLSDTLATMWAVAAMLLALRARRGPGWAVAAGAALAMAVLVRPTNLLLAPALLVLIGRDWRSLALFAAGGLPGAAWLGWYNHALYGSPLQSGYGDVYAAFSWQYGGPTALHFGKWLTLLMPAVVLPLALVPWLRGAHRTPQLAALTLAFCTITGLYAFYEISREVWWCLRFILPVVPALVILALLGVEALAGSPRLRQPTRFRAVAAAALAGWALGNAWYWTPRLDVYRMQQYEQAYADGSLAARAKLPPNALVASFAFSGSLYYYTDFPVLRWDQIDAPVFQRYAAQARAAGRPVCAVLFDWEEVAAFRRCPGEWQPLAKLHNITLWQLVVPPS